MIMTFEWTVILWTVHYCEIMYIFEDNNVLRLEQAYAFIAIILRDDALQRKILIQLHKLRVL